MRVLQWLNSKSGNYISALAIFTFNAILLNMIRSLVDFSVLRLIVIVNYFILLPISLIILLRMKKYLALLLLILYFFPVPFRFFLNHEAIINCDKKVLYQTAVKVEKFIYSYKRFPSTWDELKDSGHITAVPVSWYDFTPFRVDNSFSRNLLISGPVMEQDGELRFLYYDHNKRDFFLGVQGDTEDLK